MRPRRIGDLYADPAGDTLWKGREVIITATERILLHSLLTANDRQSRRDVDRGHFVSLMTLADRLDTSTETTKVYVSRIRRAFRLVDPDFDMIENESGVGYRWRVGSKAPAVTARARNGRYVLYDDGSLLLNNCVRVFFDARKAARILAILKALIDAQGDFVTTARLEQLTGLRQRNGLSCAISRIRRRMEDGRLEGYQIQASWGRGYRLL